MIWDSQFEALSLELLSRRRWLAAAVGSAAFPAWASGQPTSGMGKKPSAEDLKKGAKETPGSVTETTDERHNAPATRFRFIDQKKVPRDVLAQVLLEGQDGSLLICGTDGRMWPVAANSISNREVTKSPFESLSKEELGRQLTLELGTGFQAYLSPHYVVCTNTSEAYAKWCSGLLERLAKAFRDYWEQRKLKTTEPRFPLVVILFQTQQQFAEFATQDVGPEVATVPGYFVIPSNRIVLYDLTSNSRGTSARTPAEIEQRLSAAQGNVATVIHEATHQIAFNCGIHTRMADNPVWLTEGMATYFETPDLRSKSGWRTVGLINRPRLLKFREYMARQRGEDSLDSLIRNDARLISAETAEYAYAESWALTYYLVRKQPEAYVEFLYFLSAKQPLDYPTPDQRVAEFQKIFGELPKLNADMTRYIKTLK